MDRELRDSKVLVTGGAGFIGSNLIRSFLANGNYVVCLDNLATGKESNLAVFRDSKNFRFIKGDIRNLKDCERAVSDVDFVFHEAALGSVPRSIKNPVDTTDVNIGGFVKMLYASHEAGVKRFIYAVSSSVYGNIPDLPKTEDKVGSPLSPYAVTKLADELFAANFSLNYGLNSIGLRYFNVFGPGQDPDGPYAAVIPRFLSLLKVHRRPVINGDGQHSRDFTYIENVIRANHLAATVNDQAALNQVYNIANGERTTLIQLYTYIRDICGKFDPAIMKIKPAFGPERVGDIPHSLASIEKAKRFLGYEPQIKVAEGLARAADWFWNNL